MLYDKERRYLSVLLPERTAPVLSPVCWYATVEAALLLAPLRVFAPGFGLLVGLVERSSSGVRTDSRKLLREVGVDYHISRTRVRLSKERFAGRLPGRKRTKHAKGALDVHLRQ